MIQATVKRCYLKVAPRKVSFITDSIRNKNALEALDQLAYLNKGAALDVALLVKAGIAAAKQKEANPDKLFIKEIFVGEGPAQKRRFIKGRGQSQVFKKMASHITLTLSDEEIAPKNKRAKIVKKVSTKTKTTEKKDQE